MKRSSIHVPFQGVSGHFPRSFRIFSPLFPILSTGGRHDGAGTGASGDHPRPSGGRTFVRITGFRITAIGAARWALPAAVSRSYIPFIAGFRHAAVIAAMDVTSRGPRRPPRIRPAPVSVPPCRRRGRRPGAPPPAGFRGSWAPASGRPAPRRSPARSPGRP